MSITMSEEGQFKCYKCVCRFESIVSSSVSTLHEKLSLKDHLLNVFKLLESYIVSLGTGSRNNHWCQLQNIFHA